jgi:hypothetical protein
MAADLQDPEHLPTAQSDDLLKMHAYRDAVRRTAGAYVLYPGSDHNAARTLQKYHEVLPGIGAFVLRPTNDGRGASPGATALGQFIDDVIDHISSRGTSRERSGFWEEKSYEAWESRIETRVLDVLPLAKPPADVTALLGYVKDDAHREWIHRTGLYNLRADDRRGSVRVTSPELSTDLIVLFNPAWAEAEVFSATGYLTPRTASELVETGYPEPRGAHYICVELGHRAEAFVVSGAAASALARRGRSRTDWGAPRVVSGLELQLAAEG